MAIKEKRCTSCNTNVIADEGYAEFKCPSCNSTVIIRCKTCRKNVVPYRCEKCGFEGP